MLDAGKNSPLRLVAFITLTAVRMAAERWTSDFEGRLEASISKLAVERLLLLTACCNSDILSKTFDKSCGLNRVDNLMTFRLSNT